MLDKISGIESRFADIEKELTKEGQPYQRVAELSKERSDLQPIVEKAAAYRDVLKRQADAKELVNGTDAEPPAGHSRRSLPSGGGATHVAPPSVLPAAGSGSAYVALRPNVAPATGGAIACTCGTRPDSCHARSSAPSR